MLAARAAKPKLSLSISAAVQPSQCSSLSLKSPMLQRTPISPSPISPTARNTRANQRGLSTMQKPTFAYAQAADTKSILKRGQVSRATADRRIQFKEEPVVHSISSSWQDGEGGTMAWVMDVMTRWQWLYDWNEIGYVPRESSIVARRFAEGVADPTEVRVMGMVCGPVVPNRDDP
ncbi:MAG: hypothetical protein M1836_000348 [Candelina mexicana]|nr:MAG: hypothetical protein M1836_000348 [Candelina mexicana]